MGEGFEVKFFEGCLKSIIYSLWVFYYGGKFLIVELIKNVMINIFKCNIDYE